MLDKVFVLGVLLAGVNSRYLLVEERPMHFAEDGVMVIEGYYDPIETVEEPVPYSRVRRQAQTTLSVDGNKHSELGVKIPMSGNDEKMLSLTGSQGSDGSRGVGAVLEHSRGHALSVSQKEIPSFGKQLTAAGTVNLVNNDRHNLDATAFVSKNVPKFPNVPDFNTYGGKVDYTFDKKIGASLSAAKTDFLDRTDVSALGHYNLFKGKDSSLDFNSGVSRSFAPYMPRSWEPNVGLSWTQRWPNF